MKHRQLLQRQRDLQQQSDLLFSAVSGPSFPPAVKLLATALVAALAGFAAMTLIDPAVTPRTSPTPGDIGFLLTLSLVIGSGYWGILTSRTSFQGDHIDQTWLWRKTVNIADIAQVKLVRVPGLDWLVVPRLVVRTGDGLTTFQTGDPVVLARFKLLAHGG